MSIGLILIILLILLLVGVIPGGPAPWASNIGWAPGGVLGLVLIVVLILVLLGRI